MTSPVQTHTQGYPEHGYIELYGDVNFDSVVGLRLNETFFSQFKNKEIVVHMSHLVKADSAIVALFLEWMRVARRVEKTIRLKYVPAHVLELIRVFNLSAIFKILEETTTPSKPMLDEGASETETLP